VNTYIVDGVGIPFDPTWNKIAISVSGGADSALLAYLLCDLVIQHHADTDIHIISHTRMWKTRPWQTYDSKGVYEYLEYRFRGRTFVKHTNFIAPDLEYGYTGPSIQDEYGKMVSGDNIQQRAYAEYVCHHNNIDAYYNAVTKNPQGVEFKGMTERDIEPTADNQHLTATQHMGKWAFHPFRFVDKAWVVKQYKRLNIEELFDITRSCEGEFENITYETYVPRQLVPLCGECFWCKERAWAIACQG
jgi:7-cyano-7-deazaguanine synthase in queuosine biosynthesis